MNDLYYSPFIPIYFMDCRLTIYNFLFMEKEKNIFNLQQHIHIHQSGFQINLIPQGSPLLPYHHNHFSSSCFRATVWCLVGVDAWVGRNGNVQNKYISFEILIYYFKPSSEYDQYQMRINTSQHNLTLQFFPVPIQYNLIKIF